jgi:hypothetical protein
MAQGAAAAIDGGVSARSGNSGRGIGFRLPFWSKKRFYHGEIYECKKRSFVDLIDDAAKLSSRHDGNEEFAALCAELCHMRWRPAIAEENGE